MTSPRLPLVKAQRSFLSGIRPSREQHGPKVKVTAPPIVQGQAIQWPKEQGQSLIYKTLHRKLSFPPQRYIFSEETKIRFLFFGHKKKISNFPSNFYHKFLVENCRARLMIFFASLKFHHIINFFFSKKNIHASSAVDRGFEPRSGHTKV